MPTLEKKTLIKLMPFIAAAILAIGLFLPVEVGIKALVGFTLGLAGRAIFPYYMSWRENDEELKFNYVYLMPIITLMGGTVLAGLAGFGDYISLVNAGTPFYIVYGEAIIFAYGGVAILNGWRKWQAFFENLWEIAQGLIGLEPIEPVESPPIEPEPTPIPAAAPAPAPAPIAESTKPT